MKIITISRQFGSGGRELGKRLADVMGFDYYDKEIINAISKNKGLDETYVEHVLENHGWQNFSLTFNNSFLGINNLQYTHTELLIEQKEVLEKIAKTGKDCIIVGRNADVVLRDYHPFNIFVCADFKARIERCLARAPKEEDISPKEMEKKIKKIDKNRSQTREMITDFSWGESSAYHLTVNTTGWNIKDLIQPVALFAESWFAKNSHDTVD